MSRIAYVNGAYVPHRSAVTHIEDRGYQFADGVYEVIALVQGKLLDLDPHLDRLDYSLDEVRIRQPLSRSGLKHVIRMVLQKNRLQEGLVYIQVTRGIAARSHEFPRQVDPVLVVTCRYVDPAKLANLRREGVKVISLPESRWARPDIKSVSLLPNVLGKQKALDQGSYEAILINREGYVTETNSTNFWIVPSQGILQTYPACGHILNGITRQRLIKLVGPLGFEVKEHPFTLKEALQAEEAFLSSSISGIVPVTRIDNQIIGSGRPGDVVMHLTKIYQEFAR